MTWRWREDSNLNPGLQLFEFNGVPHMLTFLLHSVANAGEKTNSSNGYFNQIGTLRS